MIKKLKEILDNKKSLSKKQTFFAIFVMSFIITLICLLIQPTTALEKLTVFFGQNILVFLLNFLPVFFVITIISMLFNSVLKASCLSSLVFFITSLANRYKIIYRDEPLSFSDISVFKEGLNAYMTMDYDISLILVAFLLLFCISLLVLSFKYKTYKFKYTGRFMYITSCIIVFLIFNRTIYTSTTLYEMLDDHGATYHESQMYNAKGFIYSVLYSNNNNTSFNAPENYSLEETQQLLKEYDTSADFEPESKPNYIFILSEAFMNPAIFPNLVIDENNPILNNYYTIRDNSLISGNTIVHSFAGGTIHSEFQALTGLNLSNLSFGNNNPFQIVKSDINAIPQLLKNYGYKTESIHPGFPWFYNRQNGYKYLGIDNSYFRDEYINELGEDIFNGYYISEENTYKLLIDHIQNNIDTDNSPCIYDLATIQSHGPYNDKYFEDQLATISYTTTTPLTTEAQNILSNYLYCLKNIDIQLKVLTDYLQTLDEPFVIVYYGDHLPYLGEDYLVYKELGLDFSLATDELNLLSHSTPFFIWANNKAKEEVNTKYIKKIKDIKNISISYLPTLALTAYNMNSISPYINYSNMLFNNFHVLYNGKYYLNNEEIQLTDEQKTLINNWKNIQYYYIKDEKATQN